MGSLRLDAPLCACVRARVRVKRASPREKRSRQKEEGIKGGDGWRPSHTWWKRAFKSFRRRVFKNGRVRPGSQSGLVPSAVAPCKGYQLIRFWRENGAPGTPPIAREINHSDAVSRPRKFLSTSITRWLDGGEEGRGRGYALRLYPDPWSLSRCSSS